MTFWGGVDLSNSPKSFTITLRIDRNAHGKVRNWVIVTADNADSVRDSSTVSVDVSADALAQTGVTG